MTFAETWDTRGPPPDSIIATLKFICFLRFLMQDILCSGVSWHSWIASIFVWYILCCQDNQNVTWIRLVAPVLYFNFVDYNILSSYIFLIVIFQVIAMRSSLWWKFSCWCPLTPGSNWWYVLSLSCPQVDCSCRWRKLLRGVLICFIIYKLTKGLNFFHMP